MNCTACMAPQKAGARFCGRCGKPLELASMPPRLELDTHTLAFFQVGAQCLLRLRLLDGDDATMMASAPGLLPETEVRFSAGVGSVTFTPAAPGVFSFEGTVRLGTGRFNVTPLSFRVASAGQHVQIVNLDQSSARVIDNSRLQLNAGDRGGLLGEPEWTPLTLTRVEAPGAPRVAASRAPMVAPSLPGPGAPVSFEVRIADGRRFKAHAHLADGDLSVVYAGTEMAEQPHAVALKVALDAGDNDLIAAELHALSLLRQIESHQDKHLPRALGQFSTADRRLGTVFERLDGLDLASIRARFESVGQPGVPERHLTWIARRLLSVLGFAHSRGILHGNVDPANIVVRAQDHNVWLVDWCWAVIRPHETGKKLSALNEVFGPPEAAARRTPSPASDIYSLGRVMIWAGGGDPAAGTMPASVDPRLVRFFRFMATASQLGRPQDAWALYEQVDRLREEMWGPHQFEELVVPGGITGI